MEKSAENFDIQYMCQDNKKERKKQKLNPKNTEGVAKEFLRDFDPETSTRNKRKMNRLLFDDDVEIHDSTICDCLQTDCEGCHFPCPSCLSPKCGHECKVDRRWHYTSVQSQSTPEMKRTNPYI